MFWTLKPKQQKCAKSYFNLTTFWLIKDLGTLWIIVIFIQIRTITKWIYNDYIYKVTNSCEDSFCNYPKQSILFIICLSKNVKQYCSYGLFLLLVTLLFFFLYKFALLSLNTCMTSCMCIQIFLCVKLLFTIIAS